MQAQAPQQPGQLASNDRALTNKEKFKFRVIESLELQGFAGAMAGASFQQVLHTPHEWGHGVEGYAKRYASTFTTALTSQALDYGFETLLKEDPRYFPSNSRSTKARIWSVIKQTFVTRTDAGNTTPAYARLASAFATGQITRAWLPPSGNSLGDGFYTGAINVGVDAAVNLLYEFIPGSRPPEMKELKPARTSHLPVVAHP